MVERHAATDAEYLRALSGGTTCVYQKKPMLHRIEPVNAVTACIVAEETMRQISSDKGAASGMPASYASKITDLMVSEISSQSEELPPGLLWVGYWDVSVIPSGRPWPFVVRFDRDTREISMGYCGECTMTPEIADSLYKFMIDSLVADSVRRDTALHSKRGVIKPITK